MNKRSINRDFSLIISREMKLVEESGKFPPKPVELDKEYEVDVTETSRRGEGIARIQGLVVFIPNTKMGDHVRVRITRVSRKFAEAEVVSGQETAGEGQPES